MKDIEMYEHDLAHRQEDSRQALRDAVKTMRRFLDDASREIERQETEDGICQTTLYSKIDQVQHQMAWGLANASSNISTALTYAREADKAQVRLDAARRAS